MAARQQCTALTLGRVPAVGGPKAVGTVPKTVAARRHVCNLVGRRGSRGSAASKAVKGAGSREQQKTPAGDSPTQRRGAAKLGTTKGRGCPQVGSASASAAATGGRGWWQSGG